MAALRPTSGCACAQALGQGLADLNLHRRTVAAQGLGVGIGGDEFNALTWLSIMLSTALQPPPRRQSP